MSAATAERIRSSAQALGYELNMSASTLKTGRTAVLALAVPTIAQPYFSRVLIGAERAARQSGYSMILLNSESGLPWTVRLTTMIKGNQLDGAIVYSPTEKEARELAAHDLPLVFAETEVPDHPYVGIDVEGAAVVAADHLVALGHRRLGYLSVASDRPTYLRRSTAFRDRVEALGAEVVPDAWVSAPLDLGEAVAVALRMLASSSGFSALFCGDDLLAAAVLRAAAITGIRVPAAMSVIGFGDIDLAALLSPSLTTVALPAEQLGERAVQILLSRLDSNRRADADADADADAGRLSGRLIVRESTAPLSDAPSTNEPPA